MTPNDFLRAITPGLKQPDGLDLDAFIRFDPKVRLSPFFSDNIFFEAQQANELIAFIFSIHLHLN